MSRRVSSAGVRLLIRRLKNIRFISAHFSWLWNKEGHCDLEWVKRHPLYEPSAYSESSGEIPEPWTRTKIAQRGFKIFYKYTVLPNNFPPITIPSFYDIYLSNSLLYYIFSTMSAFDLNDVAVALRTARAEGKPIDPPSKTWPSLNADDGFKIQELNSLHAVQNGDRLVGYKLGNIAKVMQTAFGLDHPDYGFLHASSFLYEGTSIPREKFIKPYVELEPAFVLKSDLKGPNVTVADVISAIDYALPAIEIIDSRVKNWAIDLPDTLADNGSTGAIILGGTPRKISDLNLSNTRGYLKCNGQQVMEGNTKNILGNPLAATAWLINTLSKYGIEFKAGQLIMPGSCLEAVLIQGPGQWSCTYEGWGTIEFEIV